jgi:hypothetical protein
MSEFTPLFVFRPVIRQCNDEHLVLQQRRGPLFYLLLLGAVLDLFWWAWAWSSTGWPGISSLPWIAIVLSPWPWWRVRSLTLDRAAGQLRIAYFLGPSRQRPLTDVLTVQLAVYRKPWKYCLLRLVFKGQHSFLFAVCGGRRQEVVSALAQKVADFLEVPQVVSDPPVAG